MSSPNVELARTSLEAYRRRSADPEGGSETDQLLAGVLALMLEILGRLETMADHAGSDASRAIAARDYLESLVNPAHAPAV